MSRCLVRTAFVVALVSILAVSALNEDGVEDVVEDGVVRRSAAATESLPTPELLAAAQQQGGHTAKTGGVSDAADAFIGMSEGAGMDDSMSVGAAATPAPKKAGASTVHAGTKKYLCFKAGIGEVAEQTRTIGIHYVRCDAHAVCDSTKPSCACKTGYKGDGASCSCELSLHFCLSYACSVLCLTVADSLHECSGRLWCPSEAHQRESEAFEDNMAVHRLFRMR